MKTPATAVANYLRNGANAAASTAWATGFTANIPAILDAAIAAAPRWQAAVADPQALVNLTSGLQRAKQNAGAIATKANGVGKASFTAGVTAAAQPSGDYSLFAAKWMPAVAQEVAQLNVSNPRGDRAANRARQSVYDQWVDSQANNFRVK